MKFRCENEMDQISFEDSQICELAVRGDTVEFAFDGARILAGNSRNGRFEDMYCGAIRLQLQGAKIERIVKEGFKRYDANGALQQEVADRDVPVMEQPGVLERCAKGRVFTVVSSPVESGYGYEFGIDVQTPEDEEETDTFWLCIICQTTVAQWERYCNPAEE